MKSLKWFTRLLMLLLVLAIGLVSAALISNQVPFLAAPGPAERLPIYLSENRIVTSENAVLPELRLTYYEVRPRVAFEAATAAVMDLGWDILNADGDQYSLHAVATTPWLRFQDDFYLQVRETDPGLIALHVISQSRVGEADLGANLRHWLNFRHRFEQQLRRRPFIDDDEPDAEEALAPEVD
ncbi:uncharacterized protein (DUF1499 family) [Natronocella acetinitrilica]|uniref:Uncharacterized protein (DUF1499 family) n=1 Tax=Natronocella acetinitrilica TaxID=414046 RepID=A0AAE3KH81_9GAMM|nr:uncharacterized protein (DUF1499 family) [Natronocella acetinitrilica]